MKKILIHLFFAISFLFAIAASAQIQPITGTNSATLNRNFYYLDAKATASGTDTYTASVSPAITSYVTGQRFVITFTNANTGASTLNLNSLGAKAIRKNGTTALSAGDISAGQALGLFYDGTNFQVVGGGGSSSYTSLSLNDQTSSYTLSLSDAGKLVRMNVASANNLTVPPNSSVAFPVGTFIYVEQIGAGLTSFVQGSGVTITSSSGLLTTPQANLLMVLTKTGTNTWDLQNGGAPATFKTIASDVLTTSTSQVNVTGLSFSLEANSSYRVSGVIRIGCNGSGGVLLGATFPASSTYFVSSLGFTSGGTAPQFGALNSSGSNILAALATLSTTAGRATFDGMVTTTTAGTLQFTFASVTGGQTSTVFQLGTVIRVDKL